MPDPLELLVKSGVRFKTIADPFYGRDGAMRLVSKIYRKEDGGWVEWWPLVPDPVDSVVATFEYRNDRMECDISWDAYAGSNTLDHYEVTASLKQWTTDTKTFDIASGTTDLEMVRFGGKDPVGWEHHAGGPRAWLTRQAPEPVGYVTFSVVAVDTRGRRSPVTSSKQYRVPQLPAPAIPTFVDVDVDDFEATLSWSHAGGRRLWGFETRTSFQGNEKSGFARQDDRSSDVTPWSRTPKPGFKGGTIASMVRAVGPGGKSDWASDQGTVPDVPYPAPVPPQQPPPVKVVPGKVALTEVRFLSGVLIGRYRAPSNVAQVQVWWQEYGNSSVHQGTGPPSTSLLTSISITGSNLWPRNPNRRFRIRVRGVSSDGTVGEWTSSSWCRKMPNPFFIRPEGTAVLRDGTMLAEGGVLVRQGASRNVKRWTGYAAYGGRTRTELHPDYVGYQLKVTRAYTMLERDTSGGSGNGVRPRLYYHTWDYPHQVGTALSTNGENLVPLRRGQWRWCQFSTHFANHLIHPDVNRLRIRGLAIYSPNLSLNPALGNVSNEYMRMLGAGAPWRDGHPLWTLRLHHDG